MDKSILGQELLDAATDLSTVAEPAPLALIILHADECQVLHKLAPGLSPEKIKLLHEKIIKSDYSRLTDSLSTSINYICASIQIHLKQRLTERKEAIQKAIEKTHQGTNKQLNNKLEELAAKIEHLYNLAAALLIVEAELTKKTPSYQPALEAKSKRISQVLLIATERANNKETEDAHLLFDALALMLIDWNVDLKYKQPLLTDLFSFAEAFFTSRSDITERSIEKPNLPTSIYQIFTAFYQVRKQLKNRFSKGEEIKTLCEDSKIQLASLVNNGFESATALAGQLVTVDFTVCLTGSLAQGTAGPKSDLEYFVIYENTHDQGHLSDRCSRAFLTLACRIFEWFVNAIFGFSRKDADICIDISMNPAKDKHWISKPKQLIQKSISIQQSAKRQYPAIQWALFWSHPAYSYGNADLYENFSKELITQLMTKREDSPLCSTLAIKALLLRPNPLKEIENLTARISTNNDLASPHLSKTYYAFFLFFLHAIGLYYGLRSNSIFGTLTKLNQKQILSDEVTLRLEELLLNFCRNKWTRHCKQSFDPAYACDPNKREKDLKTLLTVSRIIEGLRDQPLRERATLADRITSDFSK